MQKVVPRSLALIKEGSNAAAVRCGCRAAAVASPRNRWATGGSPIIMTSPNRAPTRTEGHVVLPVTRLRPVNEPAGRPVHDCSRWWE